MSEFAAESKKAPVPKVVSIQSGEKIPNSPKTSPEKFLEDVSSPLASCWQKLIHPLLRRLDQHLDRRLVGTIDGLLRAVLQHRHRSCGLLLSELGAYICGPDP